MKSRSKIDVFLVVGVSTEPPTCVRSAMGGVIGDPRAISRKRAAHQAICTARLVKGVKGLKRSTTYVGWMTGWLVERYWEGAPL